MSRVLETHRKFEQFVKLLGPTFCACLHSVPSFPAQACLQTSLCQQPAPSVLVNWRYALVEFGFTLVLPVMPHLARKQFHTAFSLASSIVTLRLFSPARCRQVAGGGGGGWSTVWSTVC